MSEIDQPQIVPIVALSLISAKPVLVRASYDGLNLVIAAFEPIQQDGVFWRRVLAKKIQEEVKKGAKVVVEEMTDHIAQHATPVLLADPHPDGRTMLDTALDWYFAFEQSDSLKFAKTTSHGRIMASTIDRTTDDRGRDRYRIDWRRVKGEQRSILLACLVSEGLQVMDDHSISQYLAAVFNEPDPDVENPVARIGQALRRQSAESSRDLQIKMGMIDD